MLVNLFRDEQFVEFLKLGVILLFNFIHLGLLWSSFNEVSRIFFVFPTYLSLPVAPAALPITLLILLNSISMLLIVLLQLNIYWLRSQCSPIDIEWNGRCNLQF
jgi:hypothetical protein